MVAQRGYETDWVRNIQAEPRVRVKVRTGAGLGWRAGTAHILDDDPHERRRLIGLGSRARRICMAAAAVGDTDALAVRVDLDGAADDTAHTGDG
ncbi:nitroreductase/quinone reductase family protein [Streptomyces camponoticapitis]|uniref:nitroreductase/quinone reductase family protein n=1 Tax=Streptomyces camponoticapitis TaxID=1616125 RepID=UPI00166D86F3